MSMVAACGGGHEGNSSSDSSGGTASSGGSSGGTSSGSGSSGGTSSGGGGSGGTSSGGTSTSGPTNFASLFPSDVFTAPRVPLELTSTPATAAAVTADLGPAGGTLTTTGPDGTVYTLDIPPDALAIETTITATPLKDVTGFPFDEQPANRLGVTFTPSGLKFAKSATLTIRPPNLPANVSIAALGYVGAGHDAHGVYENIQPGLVTLSVDHFSGYVLTWPMDLPKWRLLAQQRIEAEEAMIESMISVYIGIERDKELIGMSDPNDATLGDIVLESAKEYKEKVLIPRLNAASLGCNEGQKALTNWFSYWAQMQKFNLSGNPDIAVTIGGITYTDVQKLPDVLLGTFFDHCMSELYERCVATGDFFQLPLFMLSIQRQWEFLGEEISPEMFDVAVDYSKRCGHWRLDEDADFTVYPSPDIVAFGEVTTSIDLEWKPGDGDGILKFVNSKIENAENANNTGELVVTSFNVAPRDNGDCTLTKDPPAPLRKATAKLKELEFEYPDDPTTPDWAKSGYVTALKLALDPGDVSTGVTITCPQTGTADLPVEMYQPNLVFVSDGFFEPPDESSEYTLLDRAWTFPSINPFRAEWEAEVGGTLTGHVALHLVHTPK